jgi:hypothetical protein
VVVEAAKEPATMSRPDSGDDLVNDLDQERTGALSDDWRVVL